MKTISSLQKITDSLEKEYSKQQHSWDAKYQDQKHKNKLLKRELKQSNALVASLQKENERLWELIFTKIINTPGSTMPTKQIIDLIGDESDSVIPTVTHSKHTEKKENKVSVELELEITKQSQPEIEVTIEQESVGEEQEEEEEEEVVVEEEEEEVVVEEEEEEEVVEQEVVEEEEEQDEEEAEVFEIEIDGTAYFTTDENNGMIYEKTTDGDVGEELGYFENGEPGFYE